MHRDASSLTSRVLVFVNNPPSSTPGFGEEVYRELAGWLRKGDRAYHTVRTGILDQRNCTRHVSASRDQTQAAAVGHTDSDSLLDVRFIDTYESGAALICVLRCTQLS